MAAKYVSEQKAYEDLANAIVVKAVDDYKRAYMKYLHEPYNIETKSRKDGLRVFFGSESYCALTTLDADYLLESIEKECKEKYALKMQLLRKRKETDSWK